MSFRVRTSLRAEADIVAIYEYIAVEQAEPLNALRWVEGIERAIASLSEMAERGTPAREERLLGRPVRQLLFHQHRILYELKLDVVTVHDSISTPLTNRTRSSGSRPILA